MIEDEARGIRKAPHVVGEDLAPLSIGELETRIGLLREEIARLEAAKAGKLTTQAAADALFKR